MSLPEGAPAPAEPPRRRHTGRRWLVAAIILFLLVAAAIVADMAIRSYAQEQVSANIEKQLPEGVEGDVDVQIGGVSFLQQYLSGRFDDVRLSSTNLTVGGLPVQANAALVGVPIEGTRIAGVIGAAQGEITVPGTTVAGLIAAQGVPGDISIGDGVLAYSTTTPVLGQDITLAVTAKAAVDSGSIVFRPETASVQAGLVQLDGIELLNLIVPDGLSVCVAQYLPEQVKLDSVELRGSNAVVRLSTQNLSVDPDELARTGTCA